MSELPLLPAVPAAHEPALPVAGDAPRERADAARNRRRILDAAAALIAAEGPDAVTMDRIASTACVGKGTLFRRFGDRGALLRALVSESEGAFQDALIRGEPPLGPGAPAQERLLAFGRAYVELLESHARLLAAAERTLAGHPREVSAPYQLYRTHIAILLREAAPSLDADYHADTLFAALSPSLFVHLRDVRGLTAQRIADGWTTQARALLAA